MNKVFQRIIALLLCIVLVAGFLPEKVLSVEQQDSPSDEKATKQESTTDATGSNSDPVTGDSDREQIVYVVLNPEDLTARAPRVPVRKQPPT